MHTLYPLLGVAAFMAAVALWVFLRSAPTYRVNVDMIPQVLAQLSAATTSPAFAVFMFTAQGSRDPADKLNLQFSMENGRPGFDWVLLAPRNIKDEARFIDFARAAGYVPVPCEMNDVRYLRVEDGDLTRLCREIITTMYHWPETEPVELIVEGFKWKP